MMNILIRKDFVLLHCCHECQRRVFLIILDASPEAFHALHMSGFALYGYLRVPFIRNASSMTTENRRG